MPQKNKKKLEVLHLASFAGNIGDFANHQGFYKKFNEIISAEFSKLEIRKFYRNSSELSFDDSFVSLVNKYDLLVLGGGGFFDLKWEYSHTGTTIDFSEKIINDIKIPVLVNGMGYHEYGEVKNDNAEKFNNFLDLITDNRNWLVTVRNDGSLDRIQKRYGNSKRSIYKVPDNGFYFNPKIYNRLYLEEKGTTWIGLNVTNELFNKNFNKDVDINIFNAAICSFINTILKKNSNFKIILFPHGHQDIVTIGQIITGIDEKFKRERVVVAPLLNDNISIEYVFDLYRICSCVIPMRFHGNVCCIGMNVPTVGLAGHEQIWSLYKEIGKSDRCVKINNENFSEELYNKLNLTLEDISKVKNEYKNINIELNKQSDIYFNNIKTFIEGNTR